MVSVVLKKNIIGNPFNFSLDLENPLIPCSFSIDYEN
jgi:hypothetical protein